MTIEEIARFVESLGDVLTVRPGPGDGSPEIAWGDRFFYYAPDGRMPGGQPFVTVVTKDYPDEPRSGLGNGVFRVNVNAGRRGQPPADDLSRRDQVLAHPVYGHLGWVCVVEPRERSAEPLRDLLRDAHGAASRRWLRRHSCRRARWRIHAMTAVSGDFELTMDELRAVAQYVAEIAEDVYPYFAEACPDDPRPRAALDAARQFVSGARRTKLQRMKSVDAHRAAAEAPTELAQLAARAAGDAASAAYLHPIAKWHQVGHILRAAACAARIRELTSDDPFSAGTAAIEDARRRATPVLTGVLNRYPTYPPGRSRVDQLINLLDMALRASP